VKFTTKITKIERTQKRSYGELITARGETK
jgi:hypothetical protein